MEKVKDYVEPDGEQLLQMISQVSGFDTLDPETISKTDLAHLQMMQVLIDSVPQSIFWKDLSFRYVWANKRFAEDGGYSSPHEIIGKTDFDMPWAKDQAESYRKDDERVVNSRQSRLNIIETQTRSDGSNAWLNTNKIPLYNKAGEVIGLIGTYEDITERTRAEITLRRYHEMVETIFNHIPVAIFWKDRDSCYLGCNANFADDAGLKDPDDIVGKTDHDLPWRGEQAAAFIADDQHVMDSGLPKLNFIERQRQADDKMAWLQVNKVPLRDEDGTVIGVLGTYANITEQIEASEALRRVRLSALEERQRLARDLHDAVSQTLWTATLIADVLPALWAQEQAEGERSLAQLRRLVHGASAEMRTLLLELRPASLVETSLVELLKQLARATMSHKKLEIVVSSDKICPLPPDVKVGIYRIAQEALNNVVRHARAKNVSIHLSCQGEQTQLTIHDNGRGFDTFNGTSERMGLSIMQERAAKIDAVYSIESTIGSGTTITVVWPEPA